MVDGIVRDGAAKGDKIAGYQTAVAQNLGGRGWCGITLEMEMFAAAAYGDDDGDQVGDPGPALPEMEGMEAQQGDSKGDETGNHDADVDADFVGAQRC